MERLQKDLDAVEQKGKLIGEFLEQYQLGPDEVAALQGEEVGPMFFTALARVRRIHDNCRSLLRTHHQRAGLELMDMMATYQETAYERLCRYDRMILSLKISIKFYMYGSLYAHDFVVSIQIVSLVL